MNLKCNWVNDESTSILRVELKRDQDMLVDIMNYELEGAIYNIAKFLYQYNKALLRI